MTLFERGLNELPQVTDLSTESIVDTNMSPQ